MMAMSSWSTAALPLLRRLGRASMAPLRWYHRRLGEFPLLVKTATSGTILASADLLSQWMSRARDSPAAAPQTPAAWWNPRQTLWVGLYGALFIAPFNHFWHQFLELRVPFPPMPSMATKLKRVLQRVALDQVVVAPVFTAGLFISRGLIASTFSCFFFSSLSPKEDREDTRSIFSKMKCEFCQVLVTGATVWPVAQMFNFFFVPLPYRVLFVNMVGFAFSTYTSLVASKAFHCDQPSSSGSSSSR